jgi:O-acetyl-ADP-ribose deacetylase (regulator of RNase III)
LERERILNKDCKKLMLRKMSFEAAKQKFLQLSFAEKRAHYKNKDYVELSSIPKFQMGPGIIQQFPKTHDRVYLWRGDITKLEIDAIVNAANSQLASGGGVCGSIFNAAGREELQAECNTFGGCETGKAVITGGYRLPAKYIIHAVGPIGEKPEKLQDTYKSILKLCEEKNISSVAIPCISTGIYGYPPDRAATVAVNTVLENLPANVERCILCTFLEQDYNFYKTLLSQ